MPPYRRAAAENGANAETVKNDKRERWANIDDEPLGMHSECTQRSSYFNISIILFQSYFILFSYITSRPYYFVILMTQGLGGECERRRNEAGLSPPWSQAGRFHSM